MAKPCKGILAGLAGGTAVEQADAAMRAVVDGGVGQVDRPFAAGADFLGQAGQRGVVAELLAPFDIRHGFGLLLFFQVAVEGDDGVAADQHG